MIPDEIRSGFISAVNRHGYGFHQSLLRHIEQLADSGEIRWRRPVLEFPVDLKGANTRIDVLLSFNAELYLVGECKRVNPALGTWCFASWDLASKLDHRSRDFSVEVLRRTDASTFTTLESIYTKNCYQIGFELRTNNKGDRRSSGRGAIEEACTQVLRGSNGLLELFHRREELWSGETFVAFIPTIFTTAKLYVSDTDLSQADLETGNLNAEDLELDEVPWLLFHYTQSQRLRHSVEEKSERRSDRNDLTGILYREFVRPIAIVSVSGIDEYLSWQAWQIFANSVKYRFQ